MRINYKRSQLGMLGGVFLLLGVTMYMALAGPYSLFHLKQSETTEIKTVIVVARHGDEWPSSEAYFLGETIGADFKRQQVTNAGQLTNIGKERMFLLGKFLKLRYYERLLQGDPRRLEVRSADSDKCLESAQLLAAGLNPPRQSSGSIWSFGPDQELASHWQPKAVHTTEEQLDDLLSSRSRCLMNYELTTGVSGAWKNTSRYLQLLNEFRHDLQVLRQNTGLEFEDDLEMLVGIEEHLRARQALGNAPGWYTTTLAQRLAHIADVTSGCKFNQLDTQRLYAGRLLDSLVRSIFERIHQPVGGPQSGGHTFTVALTEEEEEFEEMRENLNSLGRPAARMMGKEHKLEEPIKVEGASSMSVSSNKGMVLLLTDEQHLTGLLQALKIYSAQPHYGFLLIIELHYDPANDVHFLRLFTVNSMSHNVFPEPVRVNPIACPLDSVECSPEQFERNIRHLAVDKRTWWQQLCKKFALLIEDETDAAIHDQEAPNSSTITTTTTTSRPLESTANNSEMVTLEPETNRTTLPPTTTITTGIDKNNYYDKLDNSLIVGPTDVRPSAGDLPASLFTMPTPAAVSNESEVATVTPGRPATTTTMATEMTTTKFSGRHPFDDSETTTTTTTVANDNLTSIFANISAITSSAVDEDSTKPSPEGPSNFQEAGTPAQINSSETHLTIPYTTNRLVLNLDDNHLSSDVPYSNLE